jgi:hypothetical protein
MVSDGDSQVNGAPILATPGLARQGINTVNLISPARI